TDMTAEHQPAAAGVDFAVKMDKNNGADFVGKAALGTEPQNVLRSIVFDEPTAVVLGKEPVYTGGECVGYVTSAGYSPTIGRTIAYAWLPATASVGERVSVDYRGTRRTAVVHAEPVVDPEMTRIKR
ncbi:MAG TPA: glycine cleavage T C-terminal barrel domain-containing protein, partial [Mycobacterium sp.]|nr:glycine cleavage T C-terminal barrel domain-containing protein [Mycobacterium sp.]